VNMRPRPTACSWWGSPTSTSLQVFWRARSINRCRSWVPERELGGGIDRSRCGHHGAHVVDGHHLTLLHLRRAETGHRRNVRRHPSPPHRLRQRCPQNSVLVLDPRVGHARRPQTRVPPRDIADRQPAERQPGDRILLDRPHAALLIARRRRRPVSTTCFTHPSSTSATRRPAGLASPAFASSCAASFWASRLPPRTVRDIWVGRPRASAPANTRTSHTPGRFSRIVAMGQRYARV
jgi:hypothetical protein